MSISEKDKSDYIEYAKDHYDNFNAIPFSFETGDGIELGESDIQSILDDDQALKTIQGIDRLYDIQIVDSKTDTATPMYLKPMTHKQACTMLSKFTPHPYKHIRREALELKPCLMWNMAIVNS